MRISIDKEMTGEILDIGGGGEGIIGRVYGQQVTAIDNIQEELDEAPSSCKKCSWMHLSLSFQMKHLTMLHSFFHLCTWTSRRSEAH